MKKPPVELRFWWPHNFLKRDPRRHFRFVWWVQVMANRLLLGGLRYGRATKKQQYIYRALAEGMMYLHNGNKEHLINMSNYGFLEAEEPCIDNASFDNTVDSATRAKFGGNIA